MKRQWVLPAVLCLEILLFTSLSGHSFHSFSETLAYFQSYFADLICQSAPVLFLGFGMTLILMTAGIDLSAASTTALIACVLASFSPGPAFWWMALPVGLSLAILLGCVNGALISRLDVPPIIATLGTMIFYRGLCYVVMGELEKSPFIEVPHYETLGESAGVGILILALFAGAGCYFHESRWRRDLLVIGGNRVAARYAGIPVGRRIIEVYAVMGLLAFLAAVVFTARNSSVSASSLTGLELHVIVAVVLGGTRVQGGGGSLVGTFFGVLIIGVMNEGLRGAATWGDQYLPFKLSHLHYVLLGLLLVGGVWLNSRPSSRVAPHAGGTRSTASDYSPRES